MADYERDETVLELGGSDIIDNPWVKLFEHTMGKTVKSIDDTTDVFCTCQLMLTSLVKVLGNDSEYQALSDTLLCFIKGLGEDGLRVARVLRWELDQEGGDKTILLNLLKSAAAESGLILDGVASIKQMPVQNAARVSLLDHMATGLKAVWKKISDALDDAANAIDSGFNRAGNSGADLKQAVDTLAYNLKTGIGTVGLIATTEGAALGKWLGRRSASILERGAKALWSFVDHHRTAATSTFILTGLAIGTTVFLSSASTDRPVSVATAKAPAPAVKPEAQAVVQPVITSRTSVLHYNEVVAPKPTVRVAYSQQKATPKPIAVAAQTVKPDGPVTSDSITAGEMMRLVATGGEVLATFNACGRSNAECQNTVIIDAGLRNYSLTAPTLG